MPAPAGRPPEMRFTNRTYEERMVDQALVAGEVPGEQLAALAPPLPQIDPWRPRYGYDQRAMGVRDVLALDRLYPDRRDAWTGGPHDWQGSARMTEFWF
ncbi:MAG TPA: hypothetical protein VFI41_04850 [Gemmatimonadales bacterium]|nr:hypothetical protein [Gemmatimonadales bacterium]